MQQSSGPVTVRIPPGLLFRTENKRRVLVQAATVRDVIDALEQTYPGMRFHLCQETGELREFVNVFVAGEDVRYLQGLDTPVSTNTVVHLLHSVAGG